MYLARVFFVNELRTRPEFTSKLPRLRFELLPGSYQVQFTKPQVQFTNPWPLELRGSPVSEIEPTIERRGSTLAIVEKAQAGALEQSGKNQLSFIRRHSKWLVVGVIFALLLLGGGIWKSQQASPYRLLSDLWSLLWTG